MRVWRVIRTVTICYAVLCAILAVLLGELALRPQRLPLRERQPARAIAARFGADLRDVSITPAMEFNFGVGSRTQRMRTGKQ